MNPLLLQLTHRPFPEVAEIIRSGADQITHEWDAAVRHAMPQMQNLTFDELKDSTPQILLALADALASDDPAVIRELISCAPRQGLSRFRLNFDVIEIMQEDRLLRSIIVYHVETNLGRRMHIPEYAALHAAIDIMLQRSVIAMVEQQKLQLRAAAETELKFLSFLSHDLHNNLSAVTMSLYMLELRLKKAGGFSDLEKSLGFAQKTIHDTVAGMRQLLQHEQLRTSGKRKPLVAVDLHVVATNIARQFAGEAAAKKIKMAVDIPHATVIESDEQLLSIVLQNLLGNALKYSVDGTVRIGCDNSAIECAAIWVSDEGPGIAPAQLEHIFDAFTRGEAHGQEGLGLGLAIAAQATKLLDSKLTVESKLGAGSIFRLVIPRPPTPAPQDFALIAPDLSAAAWGTRRIVGLGLVTPLLIP